MTDFFVSYNRHDRAWAEWIAWILEAETYTVVIQAWDFRPGGNFVLDMQQAAAGAKRTIAVLSDNFCSRNLQRRNGRRRLPRIRWEKIAR